MLNALSVDVEDWFQVGAFETVISRDSWETLPRRVEHNTDAVLALFDEAGVKAYTITHIASGAYTAEKFEQEMQRNVDTMIRALVTEG